MTPSPAQPAFPGEQTEDAPARNTGTESHSDIGQEVQRDIRKADERDNADRSNKTRPGLDSPEGKATQFDGNPNPRGDDETGVLKPHDDTPPVLRKRSGPRDDQR